jgi:microsomal dipeptidase-like Zn-dependent dipeptidase
MPSIQNVRKYSNDLAFARTADDVRRAHTLAEVEIAGEVAYTSYGWTSTRSSAREKAGSSSAKDLGTTRSRETKDRKEAKEHSFRPGLDALLDDQGKIAVLMGIEGGHMLGNDIHMVRIYSSLNGGQ